MPSQAGSTPLTVTVLAVLWVGLGRSGAAGSPRCDNGKLHLDRDLPAEAVYWTCSVPTWTESVQRRPSLDTVYDPEPARKICMDRPISYSHTIPNSGAFRPVMAESGEYVYCPPQRWLNNLHHGTTVFLYHPCAPLHERRLLSGLARSCLSDYLITPHPQLSTRMPIALVSWGRTLELTTVASAAICDWLQARQTTRHKLDSVIQTRKYNLLLTRSAGLHQLKRLTGMKDPVRQCCEQTISALLRGTTEAESSMKEGHFKRTKGSREIRAAVGEKEFHSNKHDTVANDSHVSSSQTNNMIPERTEAAIRPSAGSLLGNPPISGEAPQSKNPQIQSFTSRPTTLVVPNSSRQVDSFTLGISQFQEGPSTRKDASADGLNNDQNHTAGPKAVAHRQEGTGSVKQKDKNSVQRDTKEKNFKNLKKKDSISVEERRVEPNQKLSHVNAPQYSEKTELDSAHLDSQSQQNLEPEGRSRTDSTDCGDCTEGENCGCTEAPGAENRAAVVNVGLQSTPRTDEAVWAAAALGFLLVLLTLSVLHTRLYRHWRTTPSLYWRDPQQDYDSVADVIRRRLKIAKRRRKRGRRQECVLLPSSSSSDEHP